MQKSQLLGKYGAGSNCGLKQLLKVINNNLSGYLVESKYCKVLQTALYQ